MIQSFISKFTNEKIESVQIERNFFFVPDDLNPLVSKIKPFSAGLFLGEMKGKDFMPSIALLDWISERSGKKIFLNKKASWLFLCGRDVFGEGILRGKASKNELVLVQNELDENLGYGKVIDDLSKKNKVVIKTILDKGYFLRKERKEGK